MMKITNGVDIVEVTNGAYKDMFKSQGYYPYEEEKSSTQDNLESQDDTDESEDNVTKDEEEDETDSEIEEKPIGQWSKDEVKKYAKDNDIDISNTKSSKEAKEIIKNFMAEK